MSWAADRQTTRVEDRAYSLLGIFDVNMPLLYGEGPKAFIRLQEEILRESPDLSIFAWESREDIGHLDFRGLFAESPAAFFHASAIRVRGTAVLQGEVTIGSKGIKFQDALLQRRSYADKCWTLVLNIYETVDNEEYDLGIFLHQVAPNIFVRARPWNLRRYHATDNEYTVSGRAHDWIDWHGLHNMIKYTFYVPKLLRPGYDLKMNDIHERGIRIVPHFTEGFRMFHICDIYPGPSWTSSRWTFTTLGASNFVCFVELKPIMLYCEATENLLLTCGLYDKECWCSLMTPPLTPPPAAVKDWIRQCNDRQLTFVDLMDKITPYKRHVVPLVSTSGQSTTFFLTAAVEPSWVVFPSVWYVHLSLDTGRPTTTVSQLSYWY
jgi:hypothetical protein